MGSGLILLVIVAAWLAVLVPMALRSHENATSLSSVDRFSDAMRVLSRRDAAARARAREVAGSARLGADEDDLDDDWDDADDWGPTRGELLRRRVADLLRAGTPAARRRRLLLGLVALALSTFVLGLVVSPVLLVAHGVADVALLLFVVQLRRLAVQRAEATRRTARPVRRPAPAPARPAARVEPSPSVRVAPSDVHRAEPVLFDQTTFEDEPAQAAEPVAEPVVAEVDERPAVGLGAPWSPVPVPPPVYATAPVAPRRRPTVDLTRPGSWSEAQASSAQYDHLLGSVDEPASADEVAQRRRAVNDW